MSILHNKEKGKTMLLCAISALISLSISGGYAIYELGLLKKPITIEPPLPLPKIETVPSLKLFVASIKGKTYYYAWCKGAAAIPANNQRWFESRSQAEQAGYTPAKSCKDLKP